MLIVKTKFENGQAIIYIYDNHQLLNGLTRPFSTLAEAEAWFAERGVCSVEDFSRFIPYVLTKGQLGQQVLRLLENESHFILNGRVGVYRKSVRNTCVCIHTELYHSA